MQRLTNIFKLPVKIFDRQSAIIGHGTFCASRDYSRVLVLAVTLILNSGTERVLAESPSPLAGSRCMDVFQSAFPVHPFRDILNQFGGFVDIKNRLVNLNGGWQEASSSPLASEIFDSNYMTITKLLFGPLGKIFKIEKLNSSLAESYLPEKKSSEFEKLKSETNEILLQATPEFREKIAMLFKDELLLKSNGDGTSTIESRYVEADSPARQQERIQPIKRALRIWLMLKYFHSINWVYLTSGLEAATPESAAILMDEFYLYFSKGFDFKMRLVFDDQILEGNITYFATLLKQYESASKEEDKRDILEQIKNGADSFFPLAGIVAASSFKQDSFVPVEMKRYFKLDNQDPLGLLHLSKKNDFVLRHRFILRVVDAQRPLAQIEVRAHSQLHVRAYRKLGFHVESTISDPLYPNVPIYIMRGQREVVIAAIGKILESYPTDFSN